MEKVKYVIQIPMDDDDKWFNVTECLEPQAAGSVVAALCQPNNAPPSMVRVVKIVYWQE